jgi:hypothetical protein
VPLYRRWWKDPKGIERLRALMFDDYKQRMVGLDERYYKEFAVLDMFDFLSPPYDLPSTEGEFRQIFIDAGLINVDVHPGYNGVEGRGQKPKGVTG